MLFALWPSILALVLSFLIGNAALALGAGALLGAILVNLDKINELPAYLLDGFVLQVFASPWKLGAILLTFQLGALSSLLDANGNLDRIFRSLDNRSNEPDRKRSLTALCTMGLICFYDGLANSILLGKISQSLLRRFKVSRELLAYIVDSTSSAVACLVIFSTWTAYQLSLLQDNMTESMGSPLTLLVRSIPYNVYSWLSLLMLFFVVRKSFFIGPMKRFERDAPTSKVDVRADHNVALQNISLLKSATPLGILFFSFLAIIAIKATGGESSFQESFIKALASNDVPWILNISAALSFLSALILRESKLSLGDALRNAREGLVAIARPILILLGAWALSKSIGDLGLAKHLSQLFDSSQVQSSWIPLMSFAVACMVSFFTGTSWGTLALMMPLALPFLSHFPEIQNSLAPAVVGAIFGGAVFGDHCSPISDTTVVSAFATGSTVKNHARSQMPYAILVALIALIGVYLPLALF